MACGTGRFFVAMGQSKVRSPYLQLGAPKRPHLLLDLLILQPSACSDADGPLPASMKRPS